MAARTLKLTIAYDGTDLVGWQRQPAGISVQGLLEDALAAFEGGPVTVHGAGRTDAGVHALAQVASVSLSATHDPHAIRRGLNAVLPPAVRVTGIDDAPPGFHARFAAVGKIYEYRLVPAPVVSPFLARYGWQVPPRIDQDAMREAGHALIGRHDFAAFQGTGSGVEETVRTLASLEWRQDEAAGGPLVITVSADGFLRHMVRNIVGTLVDVGMRRWPPQAMASILASRDRARAGRTAPPHGLFLVAVRYRAPDAL
ncbi:MAG: tRNA pseudouridine(38-40) synthase TruA [Vicinamibacterales bacterium]